MTLIEVAAVIGLIVFSIGITNSLMKYHDFSLFSNLNSKKTNIIPL